MPRPPCSRARVPRWIVFPRYEACAPAVLTTLSKARTCLAMANRRFNYGVHGRGLRGARRLVDRCECTRSPTAISTRPCRRSPTSSSRPRDAGPRPRHRRTLRPGSVAPLVRPQWDPLVREARRANLLGRRARLLPSRDLLDAIHDRRERISRPAQPWPGDRTRHPLGGPVHPPGARPSGVPLVLLKGAAYVDGGAARGPRPRCSRTSTSWCPRRRCRKSNRP